jgi:hypothetical protein
MYEPKLSDGLPSLKIDTADERYKALEQLATRENWSQKAFSDVLGIEARRVMASAPKAIPEPAPAARAAVPANWGTMSFQERMHWSHEQNAAKRRGSV